MGKYDDAVHYSFSSAVDHNATKLEGLHICETVEMRCPSVQFVWRIATDSQFLF